MNVNNSNTLLLNYLSLASLRVFWFKPGFFVKEGLQNLTLKEDKVCLCRVKNMNI